MSRQDGRGSEATAVPPDGVLMTMDEAIAQFHGEWVLMKVAEHDEDHWPSKGYVIAHSPQRADISAALALEPPRSALPPDAPKQPYYVFLAYPRARSGPGRPGSPRRTARGDRGSPPHP